MSRTGKTSLETFLAEQLDRTDSGFDAEEKATLDAGELAYDIVPDVENHSAVCLEEAQGSPGTVGLDSRRGMVQEVIDAISSILNNGNKELTIIAGRPAMGKTAFALNIAQNVARKHGEGVLLFSLEMGAEQLVQRLICAEAGVDSTRLQKGILGPDTWTNLLAAADSLNELPIYIDDDATVSVRQVDDEAAAAAWEEGREVGDVGVPTPEGIGHVSVGLAQIAAAGSPVDVTEAVAV
jgi:hypothetical protein